MSNFLDTRRSLHYFLFLFIKSYTLLGRYSKIHLLLYYAYNLLFLFCKKKIFYTISPSNYSMSIGKCYTVANLSVTFFPVRYENLRANNHKGIVH